jgi:hypothetical protein
MRSQRKLAHQVFHPTASKNLRPHALKAAHSLLRRQLERPGDIMGNLHQFVPLFFIVNYLLTAPSMAADAIMLITYGLEMQSDNDPYIEVSDYAIHLVQKAAIPGAFLVDLFPVLKHIPESMPGAGFQKWAREGKESFREALEVPFRASKTRIVCLIFTNLPGAHASRIG